MKNLLSGVLFFCSFGIIISQDFLDIQPLSIEYDLVSLGDEIVMPFVDAQKLIDEDSQPRGAKPLRYGYNQLLSIDPNYDGQWDIAPNGDRVWRIAIRSEGAYALRVFLENFVLDDSARLFFYSPSYDHLYGAYTSDNHTTDNIFSSPLVPGDVVVVEYNDSADASLDFEIASIVHDYKNFYSMIDRDRNCGMNVNCDEASAYENQINSVAWLDLGWSICSGGMVNNTSQDLTPYFLTADHCVSGSNASNCRFYFNYETSGCSGNNAGAGSYAHSSQMLSRSYGMDPDYALLLITDDIPESWEVYYAGWNVTDLSYDSFATVDVDEGVGISHPAGAPKKISFSYGSAVTSNWNGTNEVTEGPTHWVIWWNSGGTEGGSSGSPMFDSNKRVIGPLSGGPDVECESSDDYALYGRLSVAWDMGVSDYLDPAGTGQRWLNGTYVPIIYGCTDDDADNYNPDATINDGSCEYTDYVGDSSIYFGSTTSNSVDIKISNTIPIGGVQFQVVDYPDVIDIIDASGSAMENYGWAINYSEDGLILGFSLTGDTIPAGEQTLTTLHFEGNGATQLCISEGVVSSGLGEALSVDYGDCIALDTSILGDVNFDGITDILDVISIVNMVLGNVNPTIAELSAADLNGDSYITILDIILIVNVIMGN